MQKDNVSKAGLFLAAIVSFLATVGSFCTHERLIRQYDGVWIGLFILSLVVLSGAAVNFDPKRLIK